MSDSDFIDDEPTPNTSPIKDSNNEMANESQLLGTFKDNGKEASFFTEGQTQADQETCPSNQNTVEVKEFEPPIKLEEQITNKTKETDNKNKLQNVSKNKLQNKSVEKSPKNQEEKSVHKIHEPSSKGNTTPFSRSKGVPLTSRNHVNSPLSQKNQPAPNSARTQSSKTHYNMDELISQALDRKLLGTLTSNEYEELLAKLADMRQQKIESHQYEAGQKTNAALVYVNECRILGAKKTLQADANQKYQEEQENYRIQLEAYHQETKDLINNLKQKTLNSRNELLKLQSEQREDFCVKWTSPEKLRIYSHASAKLVSYRKQLNDLLEQCRFSEAKYIQGLVDETEAQEKINAKMTMQHDFDIALKKLLDKQQDELDFFDKNAELKLTQLQNERKRGLYPFQNKQKRLDVMGQNCKNAEKIWNLNQQQRLVEISKSPQERGLNFKTRQVKKLTLSTKISLPPLDLHGCLLSLSTPHSSYDQNQDTK